jgi:glyoxylase-like metal-dependent hydrolase (beta-lactamase superfamily II)
MPALALAGQSQRVPAADSLPTVSQVTTPSGMRIHALRTGWVAVKAIHRELDVPRWWALPSILLGRSWADWMPIVVFVVEHPEGVFLVDTGPSAQINDDGYFACDTGNAFFYERNMRFAVPPGDTLAPRLVEAGIDPGRITTLLITHFHADHVGGVDIVPRARVLTGAGNWPRHTGSFTCRLPTEFSRETVRFDGPPVGSMTASRALTSDGKIRVVSLPGHTPGHVGLAVTDAGHTWLMVGDATFDFEQTRRSAVAGVSQHFDRATATQEQLNALATTNSVTVLPAHDPSVFRRLTTRRQDGLPRLHGTD